MSLSRDEHQSRGRIKRVDVSAALAVEGVRLVMTHVNAPRLRKVTSISMAEIGERLPLQDDTVRYYGECVAVVVAGTLLAAREAAALVRVEYEAGEAVAATLADAGARLAPVKRAGMAPGRVKRGNALGDYATAEVRIDETYETAPYHHNAIEPSAVIARWDEDGGVTVHAAVQWHHVDTLAIGQAFGLGHADRLAGFVRRKLLGHAFAGKVRLTNHLAGGAFGRNLATVHLFLACMAAKVSGRAVKVVLGTADTFSLLSYRGEVRQRLRLGADADGRLKALIVEPDVGVGAAGAYVEPVGSWSCQIYGQASHLLQHRVARLDLNGTGWMRAPGGASAMFALESAMDELAHRLGLDPLDLRLRNYAESDPETGSRGPARGCWTATRRERQPSIGIGGPRVAPSRPDGRLVGYGMATSYESCFRFPATVGITVGRDGRAVVRATVAEMGQGAWDRAPHPSPSVRSGSTPEDVGLQTRHLRPCRPVAGTIASTGVFRTARASSRQRAAIRADLFRLAASDSMSPLHGASIETMTLADGVIVGRGNAVESVAELMARHPSGVIERTATTGRDFGRSKSRKATFGAVFVEVSVDPVTGHLRVERLVGAFDCGQILEPVLARSQLVGGLVWGLGHALFEATHVDRRTGRWTNANLAEALIATQADVPPIEVITVNDARRPGPPLFLKGVSEIGVIGSAPGIANAIFDATGQRLRSLPLRIDARVPTWAPVPANTMETAR
jgi:xanthine dehydrogenase YagR molybdenum-binding subunit